MFTRRNLMTSAAAAPIAAAFGNTELFAQSAPSALKPASQPASIRIAETFADYAAAPDSFRSIAGVPPEIAARLPGFADFGIDPDLLVEAVRKAGPEKGPATLGWPETMIGYGDRFMAQAEAAEAGGKNAEAERRFLEASFWYFFARFPTVINAGGAKAYKLHNAAYLRAAKHFRSPVEVIRIPLADGAMPGLLRLPQGVRGLPPVAMIWGGIDVWKSDLEIHSLSEAMLKRGIATLTIDMPGTGECPAPVSTTAESVYFAAIERLRKDDRIDGRRIGAYGLSFGGHFAAKLALLAPDLAGVVENGGPIHYSLLPEHTARLPLGARIALARSMGLNPMDDPAKLLAALSSLSLSSQGLLPAKTSAPLLSINGELDELVTIRDLHYLNEQGVQQDRLVFARDRHVASRNWRVHEEFAAAWLARKLHA